MAISYHVIKVHERGSNLFFIYPSYHQHQLCAHVFSPSNSKRREIMISDIKPCLKYNIRLTWRVIEFHANTRSVKARFRNVYKRPLLASQSTHTRMRSCFSVGQFSKSCSINQHHCPWCMVHQMISKPFSLLKHELMPQTVVDLVHCYWPSFASNEEYTEYNVRCRYHTVSCHPNPHNEHP